MAQWNSLLPFPQQDFLVWVLGGATWLWLVSHRLNRIIKKSGSCQLLFKLSKWLGTTWIFFHFFCLLYSLKVPTAWNCFWIELWSICYIITRNISSVLCYHTIESILFNSIDKVVLNMYVLNVCYITKSLACSSRTDGGQPEDPSLRVWARGHDEG